MNRINNNWFSNLNISKTFIRIYRLSCEERGWVMDTHIGNRGGENTVELI